MSVCKFGKMSEIVPEAIEDLEGVLCPVDARRRDLEAAVFLACASVATAVGATMQRDGLEQGLFIAGSVVSAVLACLYGVSARRNSR